MNRAPFAFALAAVLVVLGLGCSGGRERADRAGDAGDAISGDALATFARADSLTLEGSHGPALELLRARTERLERVPVSRREQAETWLRLGDTETELGDNVSAMQHLSRAIELARAAGDRGLEARALNAWGRAAKNNGLFDAARSSHESAAEVARTLGPGGLDELAMATQGVANVLRRIPARRDSTALLLAEACAILRQAEGDTSLGVARLRVNQALVLLQLERRAEARPLLEAARPVLARHLGPDHAARALEASLTGWLAFRDGDLALAESALEQSLASYSRLRAAARGNDRLRYRPKVADVLAAVHLAAGHPDRAWSTLDAYQSHLVVETASGGFPVARPIEEIRARLDPGTALVGWLDVNLVDEDPVESWIYVLRDRGPARWFRLETPARDFGALRRQLVRSVRSVFRLAEDDALVALQRGAWRERFAKAEPALEGVTNLVVVLSAKTVGTPLDTFVDDRGRALVDRFAMRYVQSPTALVAGTRSAAAAAASPRGPATTTAFFVDGALDARENGSEARIGIDARFASHTHVRPGSGTEERLHEAWDGDDAPATDAPRLVQFDGHTLVDYRLPGNAALVLDAHGRGMKAMAIPGKPGDAYVDDGSDGLLTAAEIERLRLPADLVVLAACQSAGRYDYGAFIGIGDAFLRAGARSVLTSLWPVDEDATVEVLRRFYAHAYDPDGTPREPAVRALQQARRELRTYVDARGERPFAHPAYWAPFVLVGDTR